MASQILLLYGAAIVQPLGDPIGLWYITTSKPGEDLVALFVAVGGPMRSPAVRGGVSEAPVEQDRSASHG